MSGKTIKLQKCFLKTKVEHYAEILKTFFLAFEWIKKN